MVLFSLTNEDASTKDKHLEIKFYDRKLANDIIMWGLGGYFLSSLLSNEDLLVARVMS